MMETSDAGVEMIISFEGIRLQAYRDVVGVWTIGFGHTGPEIGPSTTWTMEQANDAFFARLENEFEPAVNEVCDENTTQQQFDAMVSLIYNIGVGSYATSKKKGTGFRGSSVARHHKAHEYEEAADAFRMWNLAKGRFLAPLAKRREVERRVYLTGEYPE